MTLISLFGRPGSGKTTIGDFLAEQHGYVHLPLGRLLKDPAIIDEIGIDPDAMARAIASGRTIRDPALFPWLDRQIRSQQRVVVDGYPRGADSLSPFLDLLSLLPPSRPVIALFLACEPVHTRPRLARRARADDDERLHARDEEFETVQYPLLGSLPSRVRCVTIDASTDVATVYTAVARALGLCDYTP